MVRATMLAALMLAAPALAQTAAPAIETRMQPGQIRASKFIGSTVYDVQNRNIGSIEDLLFDRDGRIEEAVVDVGSFLGIGGKYVAVPLHDISIADDRLTLNLGKEQLRAAKAFKFDETESTGTSEPPAPGGDAQDGR